MEENKIRKIQMCQLEILKEVVRICDKYQIDYWLAYGTMLGAVRHNGFIAWDDDLDIQMTMEGFEKFEKVCEKELSEDYFLQTPRTEKRMGWMYFKVRKKNTKMLEEKLYDDRIKNQGIWIDIFPLINLSDDTKKMEKQIDCLLKLQQIRFMQDPVDQASFKGKFFILFRNFWYRCKENKLWYDVKKLGKKDSSTYICVGNQFYTNDDQKIQNTIFPKKIFFEKRLFEFEKNYFNGCLRYDEYLKQCYGEDYMMLMIS